MVKDAESGSIRLVGLFLIRAEYEQLLVPADTEVEEVGRGQVVVDPEGFEVQLTWREVGDHTVDVRLGLRVKPDDDPEKCPYHVVVEMWGRFDVSDMPAALTKASFARRNAAAILMPYARETIASLTSRGSFGPIRIQPVNIVAMIDDETVAVEGPDFGLIETEDEST